ncbi:rhodanese-like domain-containing protein [Natronoarchaeum sp. GCM10025703]|uniref:rhodanese-like domain-containing protein n=1 Tax=unclassified Natronoarchaeum TaxID=2620183 RepID=UPI003615BC66
MSTTYPDELDDRLDGDEPFVLDIRPRDAYQSGSIAGSYNVPVYNDLRSGDESSFRAELDELPDDEEIVVVCKMGIVAKRATGLLNDEGYSASTLAGGMSGWNGYQTGSIGYKLRSLLWRLRR